MQTQHPGFYFHPAANHAIQRRNHRSSINLNAQNIDAALIESLNQLEFFGHRPWRQCQQGSEILDVPKEKEGMFALQDLELKENLMVKPSLSLSKTLILMLFHLNKSL